MKKIVLMMGALSFVPACASEIAQPKKEKINIEYRDLVKHEINKTELFPEDIETVIADYVAHDALRGYIFLVYPSQATLNEGFVSSPFEDAPEFDVQENDKQPLVHVWCSPYQSCPRPGDPHPFNSCPPRKFQKWFALEKEIRESMPLLSSKIVSHIAQYSNHKFRMSQFPIYFPLAMLATKKEGDTFPIEFNGVPILLTCSQLTHRYCFDRFENVLKEIAGKYLTEDDKKSAHGENTETSTELTKEESSECIIS